MSPRKWNNPSFSEALFSSLGSYMRANKKKKLKIWKKVPKVTQFGSEGIINYTQHLNAELIYRFPFRGVCTSR